MSAQPVLVNCEDDVLTISLNRPNRLNALNPELLTAFNEAFGGVTDDIVAVVIRAEGRAFSSGHDLRWAAEQDNLTSQSEEELAAATEALHEITRCIRGCQVPVIARVHGYAIGGGAEIALSADLVVASASATFRFTETAVGLVVTNGFTAVLPRTCGPVVAKEIIMLGEPFGAAQARMWGLINRVVGDEDLDDEVNSIVASLRKKSPTALRLAKVLIDQAGVGSMAEVMARETAASVEAALSVEAHEAAAAFVQGRSPRFRG